MYVKFIDLPKRLKRYKKKIFQKYNKTFLNGDFILGKEVFKFEDNLKKILKSKFIVSVNSGYDAIYLSLMSFDIKKGDEVITVSNSYFATVNSIINTGAKPVFADVKDDLNIDFADVEKKITKKTKAIIVVHLTGNPCDIDKLLEIKKKYKIKIIEDAAQAFGAYYKKKHVGNFGDVGCFSLHPAKNLHVLGDGGFISTNNKRIYKKLFFYRNHGHLNRDIIVSPGVNSRLDTLNACYGNIMISDFKKWSKRISSIANKYNTYLSNKFLKPQVDEFKHHAFHNYIIKVQPKYRNKLINFLNNKNIETRIHYPYNFHEQKFFKNKNKIYLKNTELLSKKILSLPIYPEMTDNQVRHVIKNLNLFTQKI